MSLVRPTTTPAIKNAPVLGLAEGNGQFSNLHLGALIVGVPWVLKRYLPLFNRGGFKTYLFLLILSGWPVAIGYWTVMSRIGKRRNEKVPLPGKNIEEYITIHDPELKKKYHNQDKIPMQLFYDAYFDKKADINGDVLEALELRHDWAAFHFTPDLFKYVLFTLIPDVIRHTEKQDENQVRDHYDRGNDFYGWFLGDRMVYTSGVVRDITREETLEELQDNKLTLVCEKLNLQPNDRLLDIGCGWGTMVIHAAKNYGCTATGVTLAREQTAFATDRAEANGVSDRARILCMDFREVPNTYGKGAFTKIVSLEMAEHVGIRRYSAFLEQVYNLLDDDGVFVFQVAGIRPAWQYEDLIWGLFMNKYVFPGADASCSLGWVVQKLERAGFEVKNIDVLGVHYSATIYRWYKNWVSNEAKVVEKYGERWYRIWVFFLAWSTIISRQGSASVYQFTLHKNLNAYHRIMGVPNHASIHVTPEVEIRSVE